jgi:hypothetical protein
MASQRDTGLDDAQLARLRQAIADGRRPRIRVTGSQFPVATTGTVVRVGDPVSDGADFVMVRIKVGGVSDELGFSPSELSVVRRAPATATPAEAGARTSTQKTSASRVRTSPTPQPDQAAVVEAAALSAKGRGGKGTARRSATATTTTLASPTVPTRSKAATTGRRAASVPAVTITIASAGSSWSVSASRGARAMVKEDTGGTRRRHGHRCAAEPSGGRRGGGCRERRRPRRSRSTRGEATRRTRRDRSGPRQPSASAMTGTRDNRLAWPVREPPARDRLTASRRWARSSR